MRWVACDEPCDGHGGDYPRRSSFRRLCVLHLPHANQPAAATSAPQLLQEGLRAALALQEPAAGTAVTLRAAAPSGGPMYRARHHKKTIRAATPSGGPVYCTCHTRTSRSHCGDYPRRNSFKTVIIAHKSQPRPKRRLSALQLL